MTSNAFHAATESSAAVGIVDDRVPVAGGEIAYDLRGPASGQAHGDAPVVVLLHSGWVDRRAWDHEAAWLAATHRVLRLDARGHGRSTDPQEDWRPLDDVVAVLDALGIERAVLVGCSLGAATALDVTLEHPDRVAAALLIGAGFTEMPVFRDPHTTGLQERQAAAVAAMDGPAWVAGTLEASAQGPYRAPEDVDPAVRQRLEEMITGFLSHAMGWKGRMVGVNAQRRLAEVTVPVETVLGDLDALDCDRAVAHILSEVPGARGHLVRGAGHIVNLDRPREFEDVLRGFLGRDHR